MIQQSTFHVFLLPFFFLSRLRFLFVCASLIKVFLFGKYNNFAAHWRLNGIALHCNANLEYQVPPSCALLHDATRWKENVVCNLLPRNRLFVATLRQSLKSNKRFLSFPSLSLLFFFSFLIARQNMWFIHWFGRVESSRVESAVVRETSFFVGEKTTWSEETWYIHTPDTEVKWLTKIGIMFCERLSILSIFELGTTWLSTSVLARGDTVNVDIWHSTTSTPFCVLEWGGKKNIWKVF